jgi:DNA processing protein
MNYSQEIYYNALNVLYKGDGGKLSKLLEKFGSWEIAWQNEKPEIDPEKEWRKVECLGARLLLQENPEYPELLRVAPYAPLGIYVLGNIRYPQPSLAIVGTRAATPSGKTIAAQFARTLSEYGIPIISGLALGIDESAHRGALEENGKTIAVLGTPLNHLYPKQNERLAKQILEHGGAIISEYPLSHEYRPQNFLIRNRIISGLSTATLVIEAPEKSGSLATAKFAAEQGRDVFVIPGPIHSANYQGSLALIKDGATLITEPADVLHFFNINPKQDKKESSLESENSYEKIILKILRQKTALSAEQLMKSSGISIEEINQNLAILTIKGIIKELNGKYYLIS